ncbi:regulatory protein, luxR family [Amycolatopsis arida]|uniref:Regulatory protein, luxR family n=1 Tax=Amycolatopsis arida TaxID=587909 RepID=A0A1I5YHE5_9PSEU|nr:LuxR family transcriptional regulator [Amycolatopsis arida]TDX90517.1 regulatory LuxR family protein [Amycolatopsis arida]SFQ43605.1 regulatory protein, luxR family [Amycolatopsis arida]
MVATPRSPAGPLHRPAFVGRAAELATLVGALAHRPATVLVEGEAGIGRTRLVEELLSRQELARDRVLTGACQPMREPFPYGPLLDALRTVEGLGEVSPVAGVLRPLLPELAPVLPPEPPPPPNPAARRHREFRALRELLAACGRCVLVLEDLHWADEDTRELLRFLVADPPDQLALVLTCRAAELPPGGPLGLPVRAGVRLRLGPLDVVAVRRLATELLDGAKVSREFAERLRERSAGIPFVVEEVLRALPGGQRAPAPRLLDEIDVPVPLREAVGALLPGLPPAALRLVRAAAVLGVPADGTPLGALAGLPADGVAAALEPAVRAGVLVEAGDRYGFRHELARRAVYRTISAPERKALHARAIDVLAGADPAPLAQLAEHARAAGRPADWQRYAEAAVDRAEAAGETSEALDVLLGMLDGPLVPRQGDERPVERLAVKLSELALRGHRPDVVAALERLAADTALGTTARGTVRLRVGLLLCRQSGQLARGRAQVEKAVAELADRPELAARGYNVLAVPIEGLTPLSWHERWMARVSAVLDRVDDPELRLALEGDRIACRAHIGDGSAWAAYERMPDTAPTAAERVQLARFWCNLADAESWIGRLDRAERLLGDCLRMAESAGALFAASLAEGTRLRLEWATGRWNGLAESAEVAAEQYDDLGAVIVEARLVQGALAAVRGDFAAAERHLRGTGLTKPQHAVMPVVLCAAGLLIRVRLATHDIAGAVAMADHGVAAARRKGVWVWAAELVPAAARAYALGGRAADAAAVVAEFRAGIAGRDAPVAVAALAAAEGTLREARGEHRAAAESFRLAQERYLDLPMPYPAARAAEDAAGCRVAAGDRDGIDDLWAVAQAYDRLGAARDAGRCHHMLRELGAWKPSRRGRRGYGDQLSPRELEVAAMLACGRTNREIAEGLFLSPRTVEQHVTRVLRKLGVRSRTEVAGRAFPAAS